MSDATEARGDPDAGDGSEDVAGPEPAEPPPDGTILMGAVGVEAEVLAELARAEGEMSDPSAPENPDAEGAQV